MSNESAYIKVTLSKGIVFTGRLRVEGTVMTLPLDTARKLVDDGGAEYTKEEKKVVTKKVIAKKKAKKKVID